VSSEVLTAGLNNGSKNVDIKFSAHDTFIKFSAHDTFIKFSAHDTLIKFSAHDTFIKFSAHDTFLVNLQNGKMGKPNNICAT
jgi:hypothetical protein